MTTVANTSTNCEGEVEHRRCQKASKQGQQARTKGETKGENKGEIVKRRERKVRTKGEMVSPKFSPFCFVLYPFTITREASRS